MCMTVQWRFLRGLCFMLLLQLQRVFHKGMIFSPPLPLLRSDSILKGWGHFFVLRRVTLFGFPSTGELDEKEILILKKKMLCCSTVRLPRNSFDN